jgi:hypothetical protein
MAVDELADALEPPIGEGADASAPDAGWEAIRRRRTGPLGIAIPVDVCSRIRIFL